MTGSVLGRLVWKEYRLLRGFWVGMLLLCLLGELEPSDGTLTLGKNTRIE